MKLDLHFPWNIYVSLPRSLCEGNKAKHLLWAISEIAEGLQKEHLRTVNGSVHYTKEGSPQPSLLSSCSLQASDTLGERDERSPENYGNITSDLSK